MQGAGHAVHGMHEQEYNQEQVDQNAWCVHSRSLTLESPNLVLAAPYRWHCMHALTEPRTETKQYNLICMPTSRSQHNKALCSARAHSKRTDMRQSEEVHGRRIRHSWRFLNKMEVSNTALPFACTRENSFGFVLS